MLKRLSVSPPSRHIAAALVALVTVVSVSSPANADSANAELAEVSGEIDRVNGQLAAADRAHTELAQGLAAAQERLSALSDQYDGISLAVERAETDLKAVERQIEATSVQIRDSEIRLARSRSDRRLTEDQLRAEAATLYIERLGGGGVPLSFDAGEETLVGLAYVAADSDRALELVDSLAAIERSEGRAVTQLEAQRTTLSTAQLEAATIRDELVEDQRAQAALVAQVEAELQASRAQLATIDAEIAEFESELAGLERDQERLARVLDQTPNDAGTPPGRLVWPVSGRISSPFGYRTHPITGARRLHSGLDIAAPTGTPIAAAGPGRVLMAGWFGGYGLAVMIDHGGGVVTLYAHQSQLAVRSGQDVAGGATIGYVGSTGLSTGPHLHFEVRVDGIAQDPISWLNG